MAATMRSNESPDAVLAATNAVVAASTLSPRTMIVNNPYRSAM